MANSQRNVNRDYWTRGQSLFHRLQRKVLERSNHCWGPQGLEISLVLLEISDGTTLPAATQRYLVRRKFSTSYSQHIVTDLEKFL